MPDPGHGERVALVVGGMHRSGTSALTRVLSLMGASLPEHLIPGRQALGDADYWESRAVVDLNQEILAASDTWWGGWRTVDTHRLADRAELVTRARSVVRGEFAGSRLVVLKDPRASRLLPLWTQALEDEGYRCAYILSLRHPGEVAASLARRDRLSADTTALGWLAHVLDFELFTQTSRRVVVSLDAVVEDWQREVDRIARALDLSWPRTPEEVAGSVEGFVDAKLAHREGVPAPLAAEVYDVLLRWARDDVQDRDAALLDSWRDRLADVRGQASPTVAAARTKRVNAGYDVEGAIASQWLRRIDPKSEVVTGERLAAADPAGEALLALAVEQASGRDRITGRGRRRALASAIEGLRRTGLVDEDDYLRRYPDAAASGLDPLAHLLTVGYAQGHRPTLRRPVAGQGAQ